MKKKSKKQREICENKIIKQLEEICKIYKEYNPNGEYLTITLDPSCTFMAANNEHWGKDKNAPLDFYVIDGEKGSVHR